MTQQELENEETQAAQPRAEAHLEWGVQGVRTAGYDNLVIVDVLSFSTCVSIAVDRDAWVIPAPDQGSAEALAASIGSIAAGFREDGGLSLSPVAMLAIPQDSVVVLPSPQGAYLTGLAAAPTVIAGCVRNAGTVAHFLEKRGGRTLIVPAGERWPDGSFRVAVEDLIGAGAILSRMECPKTPEAETAVAAYRAARPRLPDILLGCASGIELAGRGFADDVAEAAQVSVFANIPILRVGSFEQRMPDGSLAATPFRIYKPSLPQ